MKDMSLKIVDLGKAQQIGINVKPSVKGDPYHPEVCYL
jgi:hypothetical protein